MIKLNFLKQQIKDTCYTKCSTLSAHVSNRQWWESNNMLDEYNAIISFTNNLNGSYWHSEQRGKCSKYHLNKTLWCLQNSVKLIHIWEHDWLNMKPLMQQMLLTEVHEISLINCDIQEVSNENASEYLKHIGYCNNTNDIYIGAYYNNRLVGIVGYRKTIIKDEWHCNLYMGASIDDLCYIKIFDYFKTEYCPVLLVGYSDNMWSTSSIFSKCNFYNYATILPRSYTTTNCIAFKGWNDRFENFTYFQTEDKSNLNKIWDCGFSVWVFNNDKY